MKKILSLVIFLSLVFNVRVNALEINDFNYKIDNEVNTSDTINGSSLILGNNITNTNEVNGIDINLGNNINYKSKSDYALILGNNVNLFGNIKNDGLIFGNLVTFDSNFNIDRDLFIFGNSVNLNGKFNRNVTIYASEVIINDTNVSGNIKIYASKIDVKNGASINKLSYNEDAIVNIESENIKETALLEKLVKEITFKEKFINFMVDYGGMLVMFLAISLIFPILFKNIEKKNESIDFKSIFSTIGYGALGLFIIPIIVIFISSFIVGVPLALLLITLYIIMICLSYIFSGYLLGYLLWNKFIKKEANQLLIGLIGISLVYIVTIIPFIGSLFGLIFTLMGIGIILKLIRRS